MLSRAKTGERRHKSEKSSDSALTSSMAAGSFRGKLICERDISETGVENKDNNDDDEFIYLAQLYVYTRKLTTVPCSWVSPLPCPFLLL